MPQPVSSRPTPGFGVRASPPLWLALAAGLMVLEYLTGPAIHLAIWYTLPIGVAAWFGGWRWAVPLAVAMPLVRFGFFAAGLWESLTGTLHAPAANAVSRIIALSIFAGVIAALGRRAQEADRAVQTLRGMQRNLDSELHALEARADAAPPAARAQLLDRAGDLCNLAEDHKRAERFYGRALDAYLGVGKYERAAFVGRKLLRTNPDAVRAHATVALLMIGQREFREAERHLREYARAAASPEQRRLATTYLQLIAETVDDPETLNVIRGLMWEFGSPEIIPTITGPREPASSEQERWNRIVQLAQLSVLELRNWRPR